MNLRNIVSSILGSSGSTRPASGSESKAIAEHLASLKAPLLVNLGCGSRWHPDWLNLDFQPQGDGVFPHDLRQPLPLPGGSCAVVYHSHVLEHFRRPAARRFLRECLRVLVPGGILRVVVPDLEMIARLYLQTLDDALTGKPGAAARHEWMTLELLDQLVRDQSGGEVMKYWRQTPMPEEGFVMGRAGEEARRFVEAYRSGQHGRPASEPAEEPEPAEQSVAAFRALGEVHKWMYDRVSLRALLQSVGFAEVKACGAAESSIPGFAAYGLDTNPDGSTRKPDSLFMEARKPAAASATESPARPTPGSACA